MPDETLPYQAHSATSRAAAAGASRYQHTARYRVYGYVQGNPGCTDEEIAIGLGMNPSTARPRRCELEVRGIVVGRGVKKTLSEAEAECWFITEVPYPEQWPSAPATRDPEAPSLEKGLANIRQLLGRKMTPSIEMVLRHMDEYIAYVASPLEETAQNTDDFISQMFESV